jgi:hypothetical protein
VHGALVAHAAVFEEAQLVVGEPARAARELAKDVVVARHVPAALRPCSDHLANFLAQLRRAPLVGIDEEDPVGVQGIQRGIALLGVIFELRLVQFGPSGLGENGRIILAIRIKHHHPVGPAKRLDAVGDVAGFIEGEDDGR